MRPRDGQRVGLLDRRQHFIGVAVVAGAEFLRPRAGHALIGAVEQVVQRDAPLVDAALELHTHLGGGAHGRLAQAQVQLVGLVDGGVEQLLGHVGLGEAGVGSLGQLTLGVGQAVEHGLHGIGDLPRGVDVGGGHAGDALNLVLSVGRELANASEHFHRHLGLLGALVHLVTERLHGTGSAVGLVVHVVQRGEDVLGGLAGAMRQGAHFLRHYGETPAVLAGASGLDGRVERE